MIFHEIYGTYYTIISQLLAQAAEGTLTKAQLYTTVRERGFAESSLTIPRHLLEQTWPLLQKDLTTPLRGRPERPLTLLEKRWLKALLADPRIRLFDPPAEALEDIEPLYPRDALVYFDQYLDGDPYEDPAYIAHFRTILTALREKRWLLVRFTGRNQVFHEWRCIPYKLEYSAKDDKFRMISANNRTSLSVNVARIESCELLEYCTEAEYQPRPMRRRKLVLELTDERNALERCLLHFSHLQKETERIGEKTYRLTLHYEKEDETELLIRVLSFGPVLKVLSPQKFREKLLHRLNRQLGMARKGTM